MIEDSSSATLRYAPFCLQISIATSSVKKSLHKTATAVPEAASFTLLICSLYCVMSSKDLALFTANTIRKPSPVLNNFHIKLHDVRYLDFEQICSPHVLIPHGAVLLLPSCIEDIQKTCFPINHHLCKVCTNVRKNLEPVSYTSLRW